MRARTYVSMLVAVIVTAVPGLAAAGGVIIVGKQGQPLPFDDGGVVQLQDVAHNVAVGLNGDGGAKVVLARFDGADDPYVLQQIQDGVVTTDEASSGCGASASSGSATGLPLALAALALLRRRRR